MFVEKISHRHRVKQQIITYIQYNYRRILRLNMNNYCNKFRKCRVFKIFTEYYSNTIIRNCTLYPHRKNLVGFIWMWLESFCIYTLGLPGLGVALLLSLLFCAFPRKLVLIRYLCEKMFKIFSNDKLSVEFDESLNWSIEVW